jgi:hypothetical protein
MPLLHGVVVIAGIIFGYVKTGREDRVNILKEGLKTGLFVGVLFGIYGLLTGNILVSLARGFTGVIGFMIVGLVVSAEFLIGTLIGDFLEETFKK